MTLSEPLHSNALFIKGTVPACILPFKPDLSIDEAEYRRHLQWLASVPGVGGITCNGHAGEVSTLTSDERRRVLAISVDTIAHRVPVVCGVYAENYVQAIAFARDAERDGADALLIFPPNALLFGTLPEIAYRHFAEIAEAVDLPLVVFTYPAWTRMHYDLDTLLRICQIPSVVGVKEWSIDITVYEANLRAIRSLNRPIAMLTSFSTNLLPTLALGADGILSGHGSVIADLQAQLFGATQRNETADAARLYNRIQHLTKVIYRAPFADMYLRMKEQLVMLGRQERAVTRPPLLPLGELERGQLRTALERAGLIETVAA